MQVSPPSRGGGAGSLLVGGESTSLFSVRCSVVHFVAAALLFRQTALKGIFSTVSNFASQGVVLLPPTTTLLLSSDVTAQST